MKIVKTDEEEAEMDASYARVEARCFLCGHPIVAWMNGWLSKGRKPCTKCGDEKPWFTVMGSSLE